MCGIAGYLGPKFGPDVLKQMLCKLAHRGPDGEGEWADTDAGVGLGQRRLSIIDLSNAAAQPMHAVSGRYTITFNGEIYNFKTLSGEVKAKGYKFNENSDTAVLCPLYDMYGPQMLDKLEGMFSFAIWDAKERELFVARDHAGIKPLYYAEISGGLVFASELKSLMDVKGLKRTIDSTALAEYMTYLWTPSERTMLQGVKKLRPGHYIKAKLAGKKVVMEHARWYKPPQAPLIDGKPKYDFSKTPDQLLRLLDDVVDEQCTSDVPVGAFLSGGVDSSALVASMCVTGNKPKNTYCIAFEGDGMASEGFGEDIDYARMVARRYNVPLTEVMVDATGVLERLPGLAAMLDEPQADPAALFVQDIALRAREDGIKVLLSGTGGDEVFSGLRRHLTARLRQRMGFMRTPIAGAVGLAGTLLDGPSKRRALRLCGLLDATDEEFLQLAFSTNSQPDAWQLLRKDWRMELEEDWTNDIDVAAMESEGQDLVNRVLYAELFGFLPDHNLNYGDKASMTAGVEMRVPLIDRRLMSFMADVPPGKKLEGMRMKAFFKDSLASRLPSEVLDRSKSGFGAPVRGWLTGAGQELVEDTLFGGTVASDWFDTHRVRHMWKQTQQGKIDGAYTILAMCMAVWWQQKLGA
ncbi:MAG: asparagine synthase (glutamine-hydrolyzing) [Alphaproteobacteria bacterium]|nr:MAG: asparagine synthase (glutamine-hydrolyzing) [Alphaproteobacteria bacterium]